jgi:hypothetical protein
VSDILAKDMIAIRLFGPVRFVVVGSPRYFAKAERPRQPKDLLAHNCVRIGTGNRIYDSWEFESKGKAFDVQVTGSLIMNDSMLALDTALEGSGLMHKEDATLTKSNLETRDRSEPVRPKSVLFYYPQRHRFSRSLFHDHIKRPRILSSSIPAKALLECESSSSIPTQAARLVIVLRRVRSIGLRCWDRTRDNSVSRKPDDTHPIDLPALTRSTDSLQLRKLLAPGDVGGRMDLSLSRSGNRRLTSIREYSDA